MESKNLPDGSQVSKAQEEVWEWKEKAYEEMKHLSTREQISLIHEQTKEVLKIIKAKKQLLKKM